MVNFMMAVNRYCADCMKNGEFLPLHFVMMNIHSGMWMCPKTECIFPMNSHQMQDYIEEDMTTEKVLQLAKLGRRRSKGSSKNVGEVTKESLGNLKNYNSMKRSGSSISEDCSQSTYTTSSSTTTTTTTHNNNSRTLDDDISSTISSCTSRKTLSSSTSKQIIQYPLWENTSLLCWLDAALAMLVLNASMVELLSDETDCLIGHLFTEYKKVLISYNTFFDYKGVQRQLDRLRTNVLKFLQPKLFANYGDEDSPLVCLPLVLRTSKKLCEDLEISYRCIFKCDSCGFERTDGFKKIVMTLPNTGADLDFNNNIYFSRGCYKCFTDHQKTRYEIEKYPSVMFAHFPQGTQTKKCWVDFNFTTPDGEEYIVTQIIQYLSKKRHFISWSYNYEEKLWLEADDLKDPVCHHKYRRPRCRPQEVHIVIWERKTFLTKLTSASKTRFFDELNSPPNSLSVHKGSSPSISVSQTTPDELSQCDEYRLFSRESSRPSSLSSYDNVSAYDRGAIQSSSLSLNPFRPTKTILQKGLRNTPRYEPYIPRKIKKEMSQNASRKTNIIGGDNFNTNRYSYPIKTNDDTLHIDYLTPHGYDKESSVCTSTKVSLDFLKGVLSEVSEDLNSINDELLLGTNSKEETTTTTSIQKTPNITKRRKWKATDFLAEENLDDILDLFND